MLFREQELSLQNAPSLLSVHLCGTPNLQFFDSSLTLLFSNANLKITYFVAFLLSSFLRYNVTIVIRYCNLLYIVISVGLH